MNQSAQQDNVNRQNITCLFCKISGIKGNKMFGFGSDQILQFIQIRVNTFSESHCKWRKAGKVGDYNCAGIAFVEGSERFRGFKSHQRICLAVGYYTAFCATEYNGRFNHPAPLGHAVYFTHANRNAGKESCFSKHL